MLNSFTTSRLNPSMVKLLIKHADEDCFLYELPIATDVSAAISQLVTIYNGRLKIERLCGEMGELSEHGVSLPPNMQGLTDEQVMELKLVDEWGEKCIPSGGFITCIDKIGRRNGRAPQKEMQKILQKAMEEAKAMVSKKKVQSNQLLTEHDVMEAINILKGSTMIVYPMGLPPHDPIQQELANQEDLSGTQMSLQVLCPDTATLWWAGKEITRGKLLSDFLGKNDKTKVIAKLQKAGSGPPQREPPMTEADQKEMMLYYYKKQEEQKKLEKAGDSSEHCDQPWADSKSLSRQFQGLGKLDWKPR